MKDLKYLIAYILPASAILGLLWLGIWSWTTVILVFGILPLLELVMPASTYNTPPEEEDSCAKRLFFSALLYLNFPLLYGIVFFFLCTITSHNLSNLELWGLTVTVGIVIGTCGINVAHELGHRTNPTDQMISKWMLLPALYQHFFIEHNRGHHKNVATDLDPASARQGENLYAFFVRSVFGSWFNAWKLEKDRLSQIGIPSFSGSNAMLRFTLYNLLYLGTIAFLFGVAAMMYVFASAILGFLLLEMVNYLEHYGLRRQKLASGLYEPVSPAHSWNSNHELGRIFLYELTRHSDHHFKSTRKYQILRHIDESPQLPFGYPTCLLLTLFPPLWFAIMHPVLQKSNNH